jgi:hypothetical protein
MGESESGFIEVNGARPYHEVAGNGEPLVRQPMLVGCSMAGRRPSTSR